MPSTVPAGFTQWLKDPALYTSALNAGLAAGLTASAVESEIISPLVALAAADAEAARQMAFLSGPLAVDRHVVKGQRRDLIGRVVSLQSAALGYSGLGPELVVNGGGDSVTGWTQDSWTSFSSVGGRLRVVANGGGGIPRIYQAVPTASGKVYTVKVSGFNGTTDPRLFIGSANGGVDLLNAGSIGAAFSGTFTATSATSYLSLGTGSFTHGDYAEFDDISVRTSTESADVFVIGVEERDDNLTELKVLRRLT